MTHPGPAPTGPEKAAPGVGRGYARSGRVSPGGAKERRIAVRFLSPLRGWFHFFRSPHGLRRGLLALASPSLLLMLPAAFLGCTTESRPRHAAATPSCCATHLAPATAFTDKSLYQLDSTWTNDAGQPVQLGHLQGRVQVVVMFFASCTYACPIMVHDLKRLEAALPEKVRADTGFTLITIDPERDTPEALHAYRTVQKLPASRWSLLHGSAADTLELAALLGVKYKREATGQFAHSNLITVLNERGEIIHQLIGLNQDLGETVKRVVSARNPSQLSPRHE